MDPALQPVRPSRMGSVLAETRKTAVVKTGLILGIQGEVYKKLRRYFATSDAFFHQTGVLLLGDDYPQPSQGSEAPFVLEKLQFKRFYESNVLLRLPAEERSGMGHFHIKLLQ